MSTFSVLRKYICSLLSYVGGFCLHVCTMCVHCPRNQKRASDTLDLEAAMWVLGVDHSPLEEQQGSNH